MMKLVRSVLYVVPLALPVVALAAPTFQEAVENGIIPWFDSYVIPLLYSLAFLFFIFGVFRYFFTGGDENREHGRQFVLWSIVGFVVLFSLWGIVKLLLSALPQ